MAEVSRLSALIASQMKVDFVSSISHELRSPLHGILASVEFLKEEEDMPPMQADMINTIVCRICIFGISLSALLNCPTELMWKDAARYN